MNPLRAPGLFLPAANCSAALKLSAIGKVSMVSPEASATALFPLACVVNVARWSRISSVEHPPDAAAGARPAGPGGAWELAVVVSTTTRTISTAMPTSAPVSGMRLPPIMMTVSPAATVLG